MALRTGRGGARFALGVAALALALMVVVIAVSTLRGAGADSEPSTAVAPLPIETFQADYVNAADVETRYPALITARRQSALGFPAGGRIAEISVDVGDPVAAEDRLARLDVRALEAQLAAARADAIAARAQADLAHATLERQRRLVEQGHISPQRLDEAEANEAAARASVAAAVAAADALAVQIDLASLEAPFDGVVTARYFDEGAVAGPGAPVLHLVEAGALELRVGLPIAEAARLSAEERYAAEIDGRRIPIRLRAVTGVIEAEQRTVSAVFDVATEADVASGAVARLILGGDLNERGFWAPVTALSEGRRGLWSMYVLIPGEGAFTLEPRPVEILHTEGDEVYVRGAVNDGDQVLAAGVHRVAPGQVVAPAGES